MTPQELKAARQSLGLTQAQLGHVLNTAPRTIRKWETPEAKSTARSVNPIAARAMSWLLAGYRPPEFPKSADQT